MTNVSGSVARNAAVAATLPAGAAAAVAPKLMWSTDAHTNSARQQVVGANERREKVKEQTQV